MLSAIFCYFALLPVIPPVWEKEPIPPDFLTFETEGFRSDSKDIELQKEVLKNSDPLVKCNILRKLALLENDAATTIIYNQLTFEKEPIVREYALNLLYRLKPDSSQFSKIEELMNNQTAEGIAAIRLYCRFSVPPVKTSKILTLLPGTSAKDKNLIIKALEENSLLNSAHCLDLLKSETNETIKISLLSALAKQSSDKNTIDYLKDILKTGTSAQRCAVAANLVFTKESSELFIQMSKDSHATVRAISAKGMGIILSENFNDQLLLLSLDKDEEVRFQVAQSLSLYINEKSVKCLVNLLADKALNNQKQAVTSLKQISKTMEIIPLLIDSLSAKDPASRRWSAHLAGYLMKDEHASAIHQLFLKEKETEVKVEQLYALGQFKFLIDGSIIQKLAKDHESLRAALMIYLARIDKEEFFPIIHDAAIKDLVKEVRWSALKAAGINGSPWFNKTLLEIMLDLRADKPRDSQDRVCAVWSAGKLRSLDNKLFEQMKTTMFKPTIPLLGSPQKAYDDPPVLLSIIFTTIDLGKKGGEESKNYEKFITPFLNKFLKDNPSTEFPRNYYTIHYANQAKAYWENQEIKTINPPPRPLNFEYFSVDK